MAAPDALTLKVKTKTGQHIVKDLTGTDTIETLCSKLALLTGIASDRLSVLLGYPPKHLNLVETSNTLTGSGIKNGETLIVDEKAVGECGGGGGAGVTQAVPRDHSTADALLAAAVSGDKAFHSEGILLKRVVPSDNSCLFTSIGFLLNGRVDLAGASFMRQLIAAEVEKDQETFNEAVLGRPNKEYCEWIQKPDSWGGAIEISILSSHYGIEIAVVDISNAIINRFGEDKTYGSRSFLLFDGIHYDPLYLERATVSFLFYLYS